MSISGCGKKGNNVNESLDVTFHEKVDTGKCRELVNNGNFAKIYSSVISNIVRHSVTRIYYNISCNSDGEIVYRTLPDSMNIDGVIDHGEFITDGKYAYGKYDSSDGELIYRLDGVDFRSFEVLGKSIYAKDKFSVYDTRHGKIESADLQSFKPIWMDKHGRTVYGKDKNGYYFWDALMPDDDTIMVKPKYLVD